MVMENLAQSGLGNPVAGVLFVYRALDTLLEKVVLILALLGVWSLAPDGVWGGIPGLRVYAQPSSTLTFLAQLLPPVESWWQFTCAGSEQRSRVAPSKAARSWPRCGSL